MLTIALAVVFAACGGKPFHVHTPIPVQPEMLGESSEAGALRVRAAAIWDEDWLLETFDANLILAGIIPVRVDIENGSLAPVEARKLDVELTDGSGRRYRWLDPKKVAKKLTSYYEITVTSKTGGKEFAEDLASTALDLTAPLARGERRQGFLFFEFPKGTERAPVSATLRVGSSAGEAHIALAAR